MTDILDNQHSLRLLCCAHHGEAQTLLADPRWQKRDGFYQRDPETILVITGEGANQALGQISYVLGMFHRHVTEVINFGVAGSLDPTVKVGQIHHIRSVYASPAPKHYEYRSFASSNNEATIDCISSSERVQNREVIPYYRAYAPIVDRELWSVAFAAQHAGIPFQAIKIISDNATEATCSTVLLEAKNFSLDLANAIDSTLVRVQPVASSNIEDWSLQFAECYFTRSCRDQLNCLIRILAKQKLMEPDEVVLELRRCSEYQTLIQRYPLPKRRGLGLISHLNHLTSVQIPAGDALHFSHV